MKLAMFWSDDRRCGVDSGDAQPMTPEQPQQTWSDNVPGKRGCLQERGTHSTHLSADEVPAVLKRVFSSGTEHRHFSDLEFAPGRYPDD